MQHQLVAFRILNGVLLQAPAQQFDRLLMLSFADQQPTELGVGVGVAGIGFEFIPHRLSKAFSLVGTGQQFGSITVVQDRRFAAVGNAPLGFTVQQLAHAVIDHRVVLTAPADGGMTPEQTADA